MKAELRVHPHTVGLPFQMQLYFPKKETFPENCGSL